MGTIARAALDALANASVLLELAPATGLSRARARPLPESRFIATITRSPTAVTTTAAFRGRGARLARFADGAQPTVFPGARRRVRAVWSLPCPRASSRLRGDRRAWRSWVCRVTARAASSSSIALRTSLRVVFVVVVAIDQLPLRVKISQPVLCFSWSRRAASPPSLSWPQNVAKTGFPRINRVVLY